MRSPAYRTAATTEVVQAWRFNCFRRRGRRGVGLTSAPKVTENPGKVAEGVGFEPTLRFPVNTLSKRAPSATRPPLLIGPAIGPRLSISNAQYALSRLHRPGTVWVDRKAGAWSGPAESRPRRRRRVVAVPQAARTIDPVRPRTTRTTRTTGHFLSPHA